MVIAVKELAKKNFIGAGSRLATMDCVSSAGIKESKTEYGSIRMSRCNPVLT